MRGGRLGLVGSVVAVACASDDVAREDVEQSSATTRDDASGSGEVSSAGGTTRAASSESTSDPTPTTSEGSSSGTIVDGSDPPAIVLASDVAARGGWLYVGALAPLVQLDVALDGVSLGEPDGRLDVLEPIGVWRVPADAPLGETTLALRWADEPAAATARPITIVAPSFVDISTPTGLAQVHDVTGSPRECAASHTGVALGDYDEDGDLDAYIGNVGSAGRLQRNLGVGEGGLPSFDDVTDAAGLGGVDSVAMATFVDLEGDGDLDLFVGRRGSNRVFDNRLVPDGVATFVDVTAATGLAGGEQRTMGVAFGDYDGDEDLDVYVVNHAWCFPELGIDHVAEDHLYRNDGGVFVERTFELVPADLPNAPPVAGRSLGFSAVWVDLERDGDQDLVVINDDVGGDMGDPNEVWRNDGSDGAGGWRFKEVGEAAGVAVEGVQGMGLAIGDVDGDGFADLAFSNTGRNLLLRNAGDGTFIDVSVDAGIERALSPWDRPSVTWAAHLWDHDNDGDLDLYFSGGAISAPVPVPDAFLVNAGDGTFIERTWESALSDPARGKGSALGDLDGDGAWDVVTASWGGELRVWHNRAAADRHWLVVDLIGRAGNRDALGAIVEVTTTHGTQTCFHTQRPALGAGGDVACHFGLGDATQIDALAITWPDGEVEQRLPPAVDERVQYAQPGAG
jgi:hypothetical protein